MGELELERRRREAGPAAPDRPGGPAGSPAFVGRVTTATASVAVGKYLMVHPVEVLGTETEGGSGVLSVNASASVPVLLIGPGKPQSGDDLVVRWVGYRWAAGFKTTPTGPPPGPGSFPACGCLGTPLTLTTTVSGDDAIIPANDSLHSHTLVYQTTPPVLAAAMSLPASGYYSTSTFTDPHSSGDYYYYLRCGGFIYELDRLWPSLNGGGSFSDIVYQWSRANPANTCSPFLLASGTIYPGGRTTCTVTVSG